MPCEKCNGMRVAQKEISKTSTQREILSKCMTCNKYYLITITENVTKSLSTTYCKNCKKEAPYKVTKDLKNWGAYERGEEEPEEYEIKTCYLCGKRIE